MSRLIPLLAAVLLVGCVSTRVVDTAWEDETIAALNTKSEKVVSITHSQGFETRVYDFEASDAGIQYRRHPNSFGEFLTASPADVGSVVVAERNRLAGALAGGAGGILVGAGIGYVIGKSEAEDCTGCFCGWEAEIKGTVYGGIAGGVVGLLLGMAALGPTRTTVYSFSHRGEVVATPGGLALRIPLGE